MAEDCSLVFTTSRGQVRMAPTVPPHLRGGAGWEIKQKGRGAHQHGEKRKAVVLLRNLQSGWEKKKTHKQAFDFDVTWNQWSTIVLFRGPRGRDKQIVATQPNCLSWAKMLTQQTGVPERRRAKNAGGDGHCVYMQTLSRLSNHFNFSGAV